MAELEKSTMKTEKIASKIEIISIPEENNQPSGDYSGNTGLLRYLKLKNSRSLADKGEGEDGGGAGIASDGQDERAIKPSETSSASSIPLFVNRLDSVESVLPYEYNTFDFCQDPRKKRPSENLGQILFGERITSSPYKPELYKKNTFYLFNHVDITITYHREDDTDQNIAKLVTARLDPKSYKHSDENHLTCDGPPMEIPKEYTDKLNVTYTYSVKFEENKYVKWASRWDYILESMPHINVQWFSIMNSFIIVLFLSGMVAMTVSKTLHEDIIKYNQIPSSRDAQEEFGWKLVHGDVFRPPQNEMLLSVFLGQGTQVLIMTFITLFMACLGFLSPANRGALMTCAVVSWILLGIHVSAKMYKTFKGIAWKENSLLTALLCPGIVFADLFTMNLILRVEGSSAAISFGTLIGILAMWFGISVPLTFLGAYFGSKKKFKCPVRTNQIPRRIPQQSFFTKPLFGIMIGGILPFGCIFVQLFFILNSIWSHQLYYMFGLLFLVFIIFLITCSEATVLLCYFHLCVEDYHWWWRAFFTGGFTAVYLFLYAVHYFFTKLQITGIASTILYFGYMMIVVLLFFLFTDGLICSHHTVPTATSAELQLSLTIIIILSSSRHILEELLT
ncbi:transmembrane 9 superfamily member 2 [Tupaia chinensis]|uniref:transmembrane 9 superfamily member 2 n=1 Tax=Tupaia chinensis TaxID=246437 RepID=UPI000FFBF52E|nr:transmembrane 9 superfamily member 2 [Tupaia chinensis]